MRQACPATPASGATKLDVFARLARQKIRRPAIARDAGFSTGRERNMAIEGRSDAARGGRSGSAWSAAARAPSSAPCIGSPRAWTAITISSPARCRRRRRSRAVPARRSASRPTASTTITRRWRRPRRARPDGVEAVAIVTPNHVHAGPTIAFLKAGIHVICDKPLALTLAEGRKMQAEIEKSGHIFALTHNYTGYPLVRRAREMVQRRRIRQDAPRAGRISPGLADAARPRRPATSRRNGASIPSARAPAARSATSARTPIISPITSAASNSPNSPPN